MRAPGHRGFMALPGWAGLLAALTVGGAALAQDPEPLSVGTSTISMTFDGEARSYLVQVPASYSEDLPAPLLVALHRGGDTPQGMLRMARLHLLSEREGLIVVAPGALGQGFNDGSGRGGPDVADVDDVGFVDAVIAHVQARANVDAGQIFLTGFASGASMAQRVALEGGSRIAAVFAPAGHLWAAVPAPVRGLPLLLMWGTEDRLNPIDGGAVLYPRSGVSLDKPPPVSTAEEWARRLACPHRLASSGASLGGRRVVWQDCRDAAVVELYLVDGLGHHWPGGQPVPLAASRIGPYSDAVDATEIMWAFFMRHAR